jgi:hypothetical protein
MKRTELKRKQIQRQRSIPTPGTGRGVHAAASDEVRAAPKGAKAKPGKRAPTVDEADRMARVARFGCIACYLDKVFARETAIHHLLRGGVRLGHRYTIGLCDPGHHQWGEQFGMVSRHPTKARFEAKYGTEAELLELTDRLIGYVEEF